MTPIEEIREAVKVLRETATAAVGAPGREVWFEGTTQLTRTPVVIDDHTCPTVVIETCSERYEAVNRFIATMDPRVALELANLLEVTVRTLEEFGEAAASAEWVNQDYAPLRVARAVLKRGAS